jgi:chitin-binding protein
MNKLDFDGSALSWKIERVTRDTIELSWERRAGIVKYTLASAGENSGVKIYEGPDSIFTHESLKPNTEYSYFIGGEYADGKRTKPTLIYARTIKGVPQAPEFFEAFGQKPNEVSFYWSPGVVDSGVPVYEIRRDDGLLDTPSRPPYVDTNPQQGREHVYCIRTVDDEFWYSEPHCITVKFSDHTPPTDPSNLRTSNLGLILSWDESYDSSGDITYTIDRGGDIELGTTKETEFAITGLQPGQRYEFGVTASDNTGHKSNRMTIQYPALGISLKRK